MIPMEGVKVLQARPGELHLAVAQVKNNHDMASEVEGRFGAVKGINHGKADPELGTVQVLYDREEVTSLFNLLALKDIFASLFPEVNIMKLMNSLEGKF